MSKKPANINVTTAATGSTGLTGLTLKAIMTNKSTVKIDLEEYGFAGVEPLEVTFRTNFWTMAAQNKYLEDGRTLGEIDIELLMDAVTGWNLTDDGEVVPITEAVLRDSIGYGIVRGVIRAMIAAVSPNPETSES